jgi:hypothetical protein
MNGGVSGIDKKSGEQRQLPWLERHTTEIQTTAAHHAVNCNNSLLVLAPPHRPAYLQSQQPQQRGSVSFDRLDTAVLNTAMLCLVMVMLVSVSST